MNRISRIPCWIILSAGTLAGIPAMASQESIAKLENGMPADIVRFIDRRVGCNYWPSEPPYDKARLAEINRHIRELRCKSLTGDEAVLIRRYHGRERIIQVLRQSRDEMPD